MGAIPGGHMKPQKALPGHERVAGPSDSHHWSSPKGPQEDLPGHEHVAGP